MMNHTLRLCILALCALSAAGCATGQNDDRSPGQPEPLVVLIERNPWLMVVGSDSPTFALYSDGLVIFRDPSYAYFSARLDEQEQRELLAEIAPESIVGLREGYNTVFKTDQPTNELYVWLRGKRNQVHVYGSLRHDQEARAGTPTAFLRAFNAIVNFTPEATPWLPDQIEVLIWPFEYSVEEPLPWPAGWPPLETAQHMTGSDLHRLLLPSSELPRLQQVMKERTPRQAIELGGRKWAIAYRFPFPNENDWMR